MKFKKDCAMPSVREKDLIHFERFRIRLTVKF